MKLRHIISFLLAMCAAVPCTGAENYPYRSDYLWVTVPSHSSWLYETGENATVCVQLLRYGQPAAGATVNYTLADDMLAPDASGTLTLDSLGRATVDMGTMGKPGFRDLRLEATADGSGLTTHHIKLGFSPHKLKPYVTDPEGFDSFWAEAVAQDRLVPLEYTVEEAPQYSTPKMTCQLVKLRLAPQDRYMYGYLFIPRGEGKYPAVLCPPGAGVKTIKEPLRHRYYGENGMIRAEIEIHGCHPEMDAQGFKEANKAKGKYLEMGWENPDTYYLKDVYLGCRRWLDLLTSLPQWDGRNLFTQGGSQGGALAITTAALDDRVTGCVANHPALSDMTGYLGDKAGGYPHHFRKDPSAATNAITNTLALYDVVNFARRLKCPVRMTWGYNDNTCPPTTSWEVYNVITAPKEKLLTPINEHWTSERTEYTHYEWIRDHCLPL